MKPELFKALCDSIREGGDILRSRNKNKFVCTSANGCGSQWMEWDGHYWTCPRCGAKHREVHNDPERVGAERYYEGKRLEAGI